VEGYSKRYYSKSEFVRYLWIAVASSQETFLWLKYGFDLGFLNEEKYIILKTSYEELSKMIYSFILYVRKNK
jgi:four helix bundle protein